MGATLEQSPEELDYLIGAKLIDVKKVREEYKFGEFTDVHEAIRLVFALPKKIRVERDLRDRIDIEVLEDPEGNGPGFLALVDAGTL